MTHHTAMVVLNSVINSTADGDLREPLLKDGAEQQVAWPQAGHFIPNALAMDAGLPANDTAAMSLVWAECRASIAKQHAFTPQNNRAAVTLARPEAQWESQQELELGSPELPTVGSAGHRLGRCKPCAFVHRKGCDNGVDCRFCHICDADEKKRRQKVRWETKRRHWRQSRKHRREVKVCQSGNSSDTASGASEQP